MKKLLYILLTFLNVSLFGQTWTFYGSSCYSSGWGMAIVNDTVRLPVNDFNSSDHGILSIRGPSSQISGYDGTFPGFWEVWGYKGNTYYSTSSVPIFSSKMDTLAFSAATPVSITSDAGSINDARCVNDTLYYLHQANLVRSLDGGRNVNDVMFTLTGEYLSEMAIEGDSIWVISNKSYEYRDAIPSGGLDSGIVYKITKSGAVTWLGHISNSASVTYARGIEKVGNFLFAFVDAADSTTRGLYQYNYNTTWSKVYSDTAYRSSHCINMTSDSLSRVWTSFGISRSSSKNLVYEVSLPSKTITTLPLINVSGTFYCAKVYYSKIDSRLYGLTAFSYTKNHFANSNDSTFFPNNNSYYQAVSFNVVSLILLSSYNNFYNIGDSVLVHWTNLTPSDSFQVFINYGSNDNLKKSAKNINSLYITIDSVGSQVYIKVKDITTNESITSTLFTTISTKYLSLNSVSLTTTNINLNVTAKAVTSINAYYTPDTTLAWQIIGTFNLSDTAIHTETLSTLLPFVMKGNGFFRVKEIVDTTTYNYLPVTQLSEYSPVLNSNQVCYNWRYSGIGAVWCRDIGCGWASSVPQEQGISSASISAGGIASVSATTYSYGDPTLAHNYFPNAIYVDNTKPYPNLPPGPSTSFSITNAISPVTINGRQFWWTAKKLYQKDLINNITTFIMDRSLSFGTVGNFDGDIGIATVGNFILFGAYNIPDVIVISVLPSPPNLNVAPLSSIFHGSSPVTYSIFRNFFRGIHPKI